MDSALFAGIAVRDHDAALDFYERLLGPVTFRAHATESVWDVAEHRSVYVNQEPEVAGGSRLMLMVDDLEATLAELAGRGLGPALDETYANGVRKVTFRDPDGNEIGFAAFPPG